MMRRTWIDKGDAVALTWQCALAGVSRSAVYARQKPKPLALDDEMLKHLIDEEYTRHPFYGSRNLVTVIDWYSRRVLSWRISNSMQAVLCVDCLEDALRVHGKPEVFNTDQGLAVHQ